MTVNKSQMSWLMLRQNLPLILVCRIEDVGATNLAQNDVPMMTMTHSMARSNLCP